MLGWLRSQLRVVDAWRDELLRRGDAHVETIGRLERHYAWLSSEIVRLEKDEAYAA